MSHVITSWLEYFVHSMAEVFQRVSAEAMEKAIQCPQDAPLLRNLDRRGRIVLGLFSECTTVATRQVAGALGLSERQARDLLSRWVEEGWLVVADSSNKARRYGLSRNTGVLLAICQIEKGVLAGNPLQNAKTPDFVQTRRNCCSI